jgi:hypothetical protein
MNTTAEKKRILSMPTVKGELKIGNETFKFSCLQKDHKDGPLVMIDTSWTSSYCYDQAHIQCNKTELEIWVPGIGSCRYMKQFVRYSEVKILWSTYQGIPQTQKAELLQAA